MVFYRPLDQMYLSAHPPCRFGWIDDRVTSRNQGLSFNDQGAQRRESLGTRLGIADDIAANGYTEEDNDANSHNLMRVARQHGLVFNLDKRVCYV